MGQRLLTLRVRPPRLAILISSASSSADFVLAVRFLSQVWGGRYNPILPVDPSTPDELTAFRLAGNRPDFVFGLGLDDAIWSPVVHRACQPRKYLHLDQKNVEEVRNTHHLDLVHSDRAIIAQFEARAKISTIVRPLKTFAVDSSSDMWPFCASMFGIHPGDVSEEYYDEQHLVESATAVDLVNLYKDLVDGWKESWLDAGSYGLSPDYGLSPPSSPTIVVVEDPIQDLSLFWNTRLASDTLIPSWTIPVPAKEACSHDLQQALSAWLLSYMKYHRKPNFCVITSVSASRDSIQEFASGLRKALAGSAILYVDYEPPKNRLPQVIAFEYSTTWPADLQRQTLTIIPPTPKLFSVAGHQDAWFVDILKDNETGRALCDIQLPESTIIPELLNGPCPPKYEHHRVPRFGDGVDSINFHCSPKTGTIHFYVPTPEEVLEEILREHGYEIVHDEKRASYLPVIERFGGLQMAASAMSGQSGEVLEILRARRPRTAVERTKLNDDQHQLILQAQEDAITPDQIKGWGKLGKGRLRDSHLLEQSDIMFARQSDRVKRIGMARFRRYAQSKIPKEMTLQALLEHWADNSIIKRKWEIGPCSTCKRRSFVDRIDFRKPPRCQHCGKRVPFEKHTKIAYSLEPAVRHSFNEGLPTIALTGRFLRNMTIRGFFWLPGVKYRRDDIRGDIDILACCDGHLVFGECKKLAETPHDASSWNKTTDQFLKLAPLASQCGGALVVLATMADSFPNDVQDRIRNELADKIPFLLLCKTDMEKGYRPTQPDSNVPSLGLHDLIPTGFPELPIERTPGQRQIDYGWAMFTKGPKVHPKSEDPSVDPINDSGTTQKDCSQGDVK